MEKNYNKEPNDTEEMRSILICKINGQGPQRILTVYEKMQQCRGMGQKEEIKRFWSVGTRLLKKMLFNTTPV